MRGGALRGLWRVLGTPAGRAALTVSACAGIVLAVVSFVSLFVGVARQLNGPVIEGPGPGTADLSPGRYVLYQRYTGEVRRDQDGGIVGPLYQPGQLTARDIIVTAPSGATLRVTDRGVGSSTLSEGARIYVAVARFETSERGVHRFDLEGTASEVLFAKQSRFGLVTLILTAIASTFVGIGAFLARVMVQAFRPAEPSPAPPSAPPSAAPSAAPPSAPPGGDADDSDDGDESLVSEPPRDPTHPGEA